jgi:hypothetical protein
MHEPSFIDPEYLHVGNYSGLPPSAYSHFEHFVFFPAFDKAKNAHMDGGALLGS